MTEKSRLSPLARLLALLMTLYLLFVVGYLVLRLIAGDSMWWLALLHNFAPYLFLPVIVMALLTILMNARRLLAWCVVLLLIAGIWFLPPILPKNIPPSDGMQLHLVTFNVYPDNDELDNVIKWLQEQKPFVIALQEVNDLMRDALEDLHEDYPYRIDQESPTGARLIYSRHPILENSEIETLELKHQRVVLDINDREIAIYNVHMMMPLGTETQLDFDMLPGFITKYDESRRNAQIRALLAHLETEELPYLVVGDFNMSDSSPIYGELAADMQDAFRAAGTGFGLTWPAGEAEELPGNIPVLLRLDYVWYSESIRALSAVPGPALGSDHLPLSVVVEIAR